MIRAKIVPAPILVCLSFLCFLFLFQTILVGSALSVAYVDITGTVYLPSGQTAPVGGIDVIVDATGPNNLYSSITVHIAEGQDSKPYTLPVPDYPDVTWVVGYACSAIFFVDRGYYSSLLGTTYDQALATPLPGGTGHSGIDMVILTGGTIEGTVSLPGGVTAPSGGTQVQVHAENVNGPGWYSTTVTIPQGNSFATYSKMVHNEPSASWVVGYECLQGCNGLVEQGFYTGSGTTWNRNLAEGLAGDGQDHPGTDLAIVPGQTWSGAISLPPGDTAPAGGIPVLMYVENADGTGQLAKFFHIASNLSSTPYAMTVPDLASESWLVSYSYGGDLYYYEGYYAASGTVCCQGEADRLPGGRAYTGLNLNLLKYWTVTASKLYLGDIYPSGQVRVADHARRSFKLLSDTNRDGTARSDSVTIEGTCPYGTLVDNQDTSWTYTTGAIVADCTLVAVFNSTASFDWGMFLPAIEAGKKR